MIEKCKESYYIRIDEHVPNTSQHLWGDYKQEVGFINDYNKMRVGVFLFY